MSGDDVSAEAIAQGFESVDTYDGGELSAVVGYPVYACQECGAIYNAGDMHLTECSKRPEVQS